MKGTATTPLADIVAVPASASSAVAALADSSPETGASTQLNRAEMIVWPVDEGSAASGFRQVAGCRNVATGRDAIAIQLAIERPADVDVNELSSGRSQRKSE